MNLFTQILYSKQRSIIIFCGIFGFLISNLPLNAQLATTTQDLSFGTFSTGSSGGTVTISSSGVRSATGSVVLFSSDNGNPAIISIYFAPYNTKYITVSNIVDLTDGTGGSMELAIEDWTPSTPYSSTSSGYVDFYFGGELTVGPPATTPAGNYSGSFEITISYY